MIDFYSWGEVVIDGSRYISDVVISPDGVKRWWRSGGHQLDLADLDELVREAPEVVVIGTGVPGQVRVPAEAVEKLKARHIWVVVESTDRACQTYNQLSPSQRVVAALHLTC